MGIDNVPAYLDARILIYLVEEVARRQAMFIESVQFSGYLSDRSA